MKIGSLFSGAGGLDRAVEAVFGGRTVWHSEIDKAASKVLAYRWPDVPNLGSITEIDWAAVPPVDVLCGGFPCQDVSAAGKRAGIKDGTRSGLWSYMAEAIDVLRPRYVVIENVRGLLSAAAHRAGEDDEQSGDVESGAAVMGNGTGRPVLRAAGAVLGDLADIGYDAVWATVAAADVGAPHRRERVFIVACPADTQCGGLGFAAVGGSAEGAGIRPGFEGYSPHPADSSRNGWDEGRPESAGIVGRSDAAVSGDEPGVALLPTPNASDGSGGGQHPDKREGHSRQLIDYVLGLPLLQTPQARDGKGLPGHGFNEGNLLSQVIDAENTCSHPADARLISDSAVSCGVCSCRLSVDDAARTYGTHWGKYAPAIARWESLTRPAPAPTEPNKNGNPRLSAEFSQWLMGWPDGWVTDPAIGISRNDQLRILGNGVVVQQAIAALRYLLAVTA